MIAYLPSWLMIWLGIFIGMIYLSWGVRTGLRRFYWLAGMGLFIGFVLAWQGRGLTLVDGTSYHDSRSWHLLYNHGFLLVYFGWNILEKLPKRHTTHKWRSGMSDDYSSLTNFDRVLHSPARLTIVAILSAVEEADFIYLLKRVD